MHWIPIGQSLVLIIVANGAPFAAKFLLRSRFDQAIDFNAIWTDGQPLLGRSKTIRGLVLSLVITAALAPVVGLPWIAGPLIAGSAMAGDLLTSFLKRRLAIASSSSAPVIDELAECLFPAIVCALQLGLTLIDLLVIVAVFTLGDIILTVEGRLSLLVGARAKMVNSNLRRAIKSHRGDGCTSTH